MSLPGNGVFVVQGEITTLLTAMRRTNRWSSHSHSDEDDDVLIRALLDLKELLNTVNDLKHLDANAFLGPFLDIIRSDETTGPVTSLALTSVNKFLAYGLIDPTHISILSIVENIAEAVTHVRFVGTDQSSDSVVLLKILQMLRTLVLAPEGASLTTESVCEILLFCFRICLGSRPNELLGKTAEHCLRDMVQLFFMRLPQFSEDMRVPLNVKHLKMYSSSTEEAGKKRKSKGSILKSKHLVQEETKQQPPDEKPPAAEQPETENNNQGRIIDMQRPIAQQEDAGENESSVSEVYGEETTAKPELATPGYRETEEDGQTAEYVNPRGVRFTPQSEDGVQLVPYGLKCVYQLFSFLISLCNPLDKQNTELMISLGLTLLTVAFEVGADSIGRYSSLLTLVREQLSRNLISLLSVERLSIFAADLQLSFLLFESMRTHLKFQLEYYLKKLIEIVVSESTKVSYEHKAIALENIVQLWKIPGLVTELYLNYDCDMYCTNLFEDLTKLLAKNAFSLTSVYHTHLLSLDALLTIIESIERNCCEKNTCEKAADEAKVEKISEEVAVENVANLLADSNKWSRQKISESFPTRDQLLAVRNIKKWLPTGTEHFNTKPKKGIQFLQEHGVLRPELDVDEIIRFLRENPGLDKKMIGNYISCRSNLQILEAFVKAFDFTGMRIDEALRLYLETFRLPGEAPLISLLMEHFAEHWHKCNGEPFANADAAFTLAYAIIMLNVDQHNHNVKKQNIPMTVEDFKKNLKNVNGTKDFDQDMLDKIYTAIKNEEIVMPAEHTGLVRENYLWKVLLRRGASKDGVYTLVPNGVYDSDLFELIWGPCLTALRSIFDKSEDASIYQKAVKGFEKCAFICSYYGLNPSLDTLLLTLCKFTTLTSQQKQQNNLAVQLGSNAKARLALRTVFSMAHEHGDALRDGWKHILDLIFALYTAKMLPKSLMEAEDFIEPSGKISLVTENATVQLQKTETGIFSSLYSYMLSENPSHKMPSPEEQEFIGMAKKCIKECNVEQLVTDSKFLHLESLNGFIKVLIDYSRQPDKSIESPYDENVAVFFLELLLKVVIQNRDRFMMIWKQIMDHLYSVLMAASSGDHQYILERSVVGLLRLAIRLMRNEEMSPTVLPSLSTLLMLRPSTLFRISRQISFGLYELLKTSAQNIHTDTDWSLIFTLLECVGAGAVQKVILEEDQIECAKSEGEGPVSSEEDSLAVDRGYTSDSELLKSPKHSANGKHAIRSQSPNTVGGVSPPTNIGGWILVGKEGDIQPILNRPSPENQYSLVHDRQLLEHDPFALVKCCESLAFLVRDVAHITPYNFENCVHCIRTFVEASIHGVNRSRKTSSREQPVRLRKKPSNKTRTERSKRNKSSKPVQSSDEESDAEDLPNGYHQVSIQLLDLMHTLHTRTAQIFKWWAEENGELPEYTSLWIQGWCPLLQGIARLCCDNRRQIRMSAITYLQRALLVHDLQALTGPEWEACFSKVLFPLLAKLLEPIGSRDASEVEETRMRSATLLSKVFLHHLTPLLSLPTFKTLWLTILDFMDKYMHADKSELLYEAIPELLKNMILVMDSAKVFNNSEDYGHLFTVTWSRIDSFLPGMKEELFKEQAAAADANTEKVKDESNESQIIAESNASSSPLIVQDNDASYKAQLAKATQVNNQHSVSSPLFAHLGQMISTAIAAPSSDYSMQTSVWPQPQTMVMETVPQITEAPSLFTEYVANPYNLAASEALEAERPSMAEEKVPSVFQSANYFSTSSGGNDAADDFLFGTIATAADQKPA